MNNFFYEESDFALFKKALKATNNEPVVVNILSSDPSLKSDDKTKPLERKNASNYKENYQPNTYDRLFGPRRRTPQSIDLNNFTGWKNKNFRKTEQNLEKQENQPKFSLSEYMNQRLGKNKYNSVDTSKNENQKSIDKIGVEDPQYKKFYLDSYMTKLEQESKVKQKFDEDILSPLGEDNLQEVVPDSSQDEEFGYNETSAKQFAEEVNVSGERYRIEPSEIDLINKKMEDKKKRDEGRGKPEQYTLDPNEDFDLSKFKFDDEPDKAEQKEPEKAEQKEEPEKKPEFRSRGNSILARRIEQMQRQKDASKEAQKTQDEKFRQIEQLQEKIDRLIRLTESKPEGQKEEALEQGKSRIVVETQTTRREVDEMYIKRLDEYFKRVKQEEAKERRRKKREELNNALKVSLQKSEIEMNKKLLEIASSQGKDASIKRRSSKKIKPETKEQNKVVIVNIEGNGNGADNASVNKKVIGVAGDGGSGDVGSGGVGVVAAGSANVNVKVEPAVPKKKRKYKPKRHMDSDIVGNIEF